MPTMTRRNQAPIRRKDRQDQLEKVSANLVSSLGNFEEDISQSSFDEFESSNEIYRIPSRLGFCYNLNNQHYTFFIMNFFLFGKNIEGDYVFSLMY